ncbi:MAG: hypothetical protein QGF78_06215 [Candidatus Bathyarchaeota archaeon]|jgi:Zn-dependent protease with chaperone function|nr:hypothetical protein [Candidatus Bathyarchaeota archaeon]
MWRLEAKLRPVIIFHFAIHFAFIFFLSWVLLSLLLRFDPVTITAMGFLLTITSLFMEVMIGSSQVVNHLNPRWLSEASNPVIWALVHGEASRAGIKITKIGVINSESPNALIVASLRGEPILLLTKGLMLRLSYREMRAVISYLIGTSMSGFLVAATMFAGILILSYRLTGRYIESRVGNPREQFVNKAMAAIGYIPFALTVSQYVTATRSASSFGDRYAVNQTRDPSAYIMALIKVANDTASQSERDNRTLFTPVKGLMFMDPTLAIRDYPVLLKAARSQGIRLEMIPGYSHETLESSGVEYHVFEWFWSQLGPLERFRGAIRAGKKIEYPLKIGLAWIE